MFNQCGGAGPFVTLDNSVPNKRDGKIMFASFLIFLCLMNVLERHFHNFYD